MEFEIIGENMGFPEGPVVCDDGSVFVCEVRGERITRVKPDGSKQHIADIDGAPNGLAFGPDGALYCCNNGGFNWQEGLDVPVGPAANYRSGSIDRIDLATGKVERVYDSCDGAPLAGPNDIVFDADGGMWFTDFGQTFPQHALLGGLYHARPDGSAIRRVAHGLALNGVGLSPDGRTVYASASYLRWLLAFDAAPDAPDQGQGFMAGRIVASYEGRRVLDSLAVEADGTIAQAVVFEGSGISRVNPATGEENTLPFPDRMTTNIAFGGNDMQTAYITLAETNLLVRARWPAAGLRLPFNG